MRIALCSAFIAVLISCGCSSRARVQNHIPANTGVYDDAEGYAVLSTLLGSAGQETHSATVRINMVTHVESTSGVHSLEDCTKIPDEFREAANDYERRAKTSYVLKKRFSIKTQYELVGEPHIGSSGVRNPPATDKDALERSSNGTFYLSPVGFDASHTHAIAYKNYICGNLCGWGAYHFLVKNGDRWEETKDIIGCVWQY